AAHHEHGMIDVREPILHGVAQAVDKRHPDPKTAAFDVIVAGDGFHRGRIVAEVLTPANQLPRDVALVGWCSWTLQHRRHGDGRVALERGDDDLTGERVTEQHDALQPHRLHPGGETVRQLIDRQYPVRLRAVAETWKIGCEDR